MIPTGTPRPIRCRTFLPAIVLALVSWAGPPAQAQVVTRGPYLQLGTPTSIVVRWRTGTATDSRVWYGSQPGSLTSSVSSPTITTEHVMTLTGLLSFNLYYYAVGTGSQMLRGNDFEHFFVTSPPVGSTGARRIWVLGDSGTANAAAQSVRDAFLAFNGAVRTDLWLMLGDNAYPDGTDAQYQAAVFDMYPQVLRKSVLWPTLGNHDGHTADSATQTGPYYDIFTLPRSGEAGGLSSGTEAYYSFDFGDIHFICLESFETNRSPGGAMMTWLNMDLASTAQEWVIAFWHHPPYSKGSHNSDTEIELIEMRQNALPILEGHGVDLVLTGHSHSYERSFLIDGHYGLSTTFSSSNLVDGGDGRPSGSGAYHKPPGMAAHEGAVYAVAGSSGQTSGGALNHPAMFISLNVLGSMVLDVNGSRLDAVFLDSQGGIQDSFTILKAPPAPPTSLTAAAVSESRIDLSWTDASTDETAFAIERSLDGTTWAEVATVAANTTAHSDQGLSRLTTYSYRVKSRNASGDSAPSNVASATTLGFTDAVALGETLVAGTVTGSYLDTRSSDGVYESIQEVETKGRNRVNSLEEVWRFDVTAGNSVTLFLKAFMTQSRDGDSFAFAWSADGANYTGVLTVTRTSDDGTYQSASLPPALQGTVYIRAQDTNRQAGSRGKDTLRVDHMFIRSQ